MHQLHVMTDAFVTGIGDQQHDASPGPLSCGDEVFPADSIPKSSLHSLFGEIVGKNKPRDSRIVVMIGPQGERPAGAFAKVCAKKGADPGASAFRHRDHNGVATGKFARATAEIPAV